ncbi:ORF6N domain-containing protein [bacterium]|nr:ORF6N domain-containing protein [bacterium]
MKKEIVNFHAVENRIMDVRGQKVLLDSDVAALYGVETMRVNEAVKNNPDKFPDGYILELTKKEKAEVIENFDNPKLKFSPTMPKAFTEKGLYMLATILKSDLATQTTLAIVEAFAKLRELSRTVAEMSTTRDSYAQKSLMEKSGDIFADLLGEDLQVSDTETSFEVNLALLKFKHIIKRKTEK